MRKDEEKTARSKYCLEADRELAAALLGICGRNDRDVIFQERLKQSFQVAC
jgi:hypothetical protein